MQLPVAFSADAARSLGGPDWLVERRLAALDRFAAAPPPPLDEDLWRYGRIGELDLDRYVPTGSSDAAGPEPVLDAGEWPEVARLLELVGERSGLALVVDGQVATSDLAPGASAAGVRLGALTDQAAGAAVLDCLPLLNGETGKEEHLPDPFDHLADAFCADALVLSVPAGARLAHPVIIVHVLGARAGADLAPAMFPRTIVDVGEGAEAGVIELLVSGDEAMLVVPTVDLLAADGANLTYATIQQLGARSWQLAHQRARAGRDATFRSFTASLGADYARFRTESVLAGKGGSAELLAAYLGDRKQVHDFRTLQEHGAPRTISDLVFKGAVGGTARSVYSGLIRMRKGAKGATAFQTNRNLVLSDGAHADSVPNLDIEENDVKCSHASAVGQIDPEQRFYLESRGVPPEAAERLILLGFFEDLWQRITLPGVREHLAASVAGRLKAVTGG
jgi:Fe-S cluster assembly protein SufD